MIDDLHEHGCKPRLLQPCFGGAALHFHAVFGIDRYDQKNVRIQQILEAIRIMGLRSGFERVDRIVGQRRPQKIERLQ